MTSGGIEIMILIKVQDSNAFTMYLHRYLQVATTIDQVSSAYHRTLQQPVFVHKYMITTDNEPVHAHIYTVQLRSKILQLVECSTKSICTQVSIQFSAFNYNIVS